MLQGSLATHIVLSRNNDRAVYNLGIRQVFIVATAMVCLATFALESRTQKQSPGGQPAVEGNSQCGGGRPTALVAPVGTI